MNAKSGRIPLKMDYRMAKEPNRGDIWSVNLEPTKGHEQGGERPCLIISVDSFNSSPAELVVVIPITSKNKNIPLHVEINPPEGGLSKVSYAKCEDIRSISKSRLQKYWGKLESNNLVEVERRLKLLLAI